MSVSIKELGTEYGYRFVELNGTDQGTGIKFLADTYSVKSGVVYNIDGHEMTEGDFETVAVCNHIIELHNFTM